MKAFFANPEVNRLTFHATLHKLAWTGANIFSGAYMLHAGLALAEVFLAYAGIFAVRFVLRWLVLAIAPRLGLRGSLILGTVLIAAQYPILAGVEGIDAALFAYCLVNALATVVYMTAYHACFAVLGDIEDRGKQVGVRQALGTVAGIAGPALGGVLLAVMGPWVAFGAAAIVELLAILPLLRLPPLPAPSRPGAYPYAGARPGVLLFLTDGWIVATSILGWNLFIFQAMDGRFDGMGGVLAAAAVAGALSGMVLGHLIDLGHARRATVLNAAAMLLVVAMKSLVGSDGLVVLGVTLAAMFLGGLYTPLLMTAFYNAAKPAGSALHFQFASEGGWDVGAVAASLIAAACIAAGGSLQLAIAVALPLVVVQAWLLRATYPR